MDRLLARLEPLLGRCEGEPVALDGGITNRNYRVRMGGSDYVVRRPGKDTRLLGIDRAVEREAAEAAHRAGVAPAVCAYVVDEDTLVTEFVDGRAMTPEGVRANLPRVARSLRAVHACAPLVATFSPYRVCERYLETARRRGGDISERILVAADVAARIEAALGTPQRLVLCHNDLLAGNFLDDGDRLWIIDWEYAGMGDVWFDLGNISVNNDFSVDDDTALIETYFAVCDEPRLARVRLMRAVSDWREAMWGVVQQTVSDLDFDFAAYADAHVARMLDSDWEEWLDAATA